MRVRGQALAPTTAMSRDRGFATALVYGAIAGVNGAACMSVLRLAARRMGLIDKMPPQVVQDWLARQLGADPKDDVLHHVADHAVHLTIGAAGGAVYGALTSSRRPTYSSGVLHGLAVWAIGFFALIPRLGIARSAAHAEPRENLVNIAAHAVYGAILALFVGEMRAQGRRPASRPERYMTRVG